MLFNSPEFLLFLPIVFGPNWFNASTRGQNLLVTEAYVDILKQKAQEYDVTIDTVIIDVYPEFQQEWVVKKMDAIEDMAQSIPLSALFDHQSIFLRGRHGSRLHARVVHQLKRPSLKKSDNSVKAAWLEFAGYEPMKSEAFENDRPLSWDNRLSPAIVVWKF